MQKTAVVVEREGRPARIRTVASTWTAKYRDGTNRLVEVSTGCTSKTAAQSLLDQLVRDAELVRANVISRSQMEVSDYQCALTETHMEDYLAYMQRRKCSPVYIADTRRKLERAAKECGFRRLHDLNSDRLESWLADLNATPMTKKAADDPDKEMISATVYNAYIAAWSAFGNWLAGKRTMGKRSNWKGEKRLESSPFGGMGKVDPEADRRRVARALTEEEVGRLLAAAVERPFADAETVRIGPNKGKRVIVLSESRRTALAKIGAERRLIYLTALLTGLRQNELRTLEIRDLSFGDQPFIRLKHSNEKNRQGTTIPVQRELATELQHWVKSRPIAERVFRVPTQSTRLLNRDLVFAGIPKIDARGRVLHFHSLRHTFGTHLSLAGVSPRAAQSAMRHSSLSLTMKVYTDPNLLDTAAAVERLPKFGRNPVAPMVAPDSAKPCV